MAVGGISHLGTILILGDIQRPSLTPDRWLGNGNPPDLTKA